MKQWSRFFQNEAFLEKTRLYLLREDQRAYVAERIGLRPGLRVLEVGCGTGAFSRYLARSVREVSFTGLDLDPDFIEAARRLAPEGEGGCGFTFLQGDALALPFEEGTFDAVVSHTFFNSVPRYREALREMIRVCRVGGTVASVTAMDLNHVPVSGGIWPKDADAWKPAYDALFVKVQAMYERVAPLRDYTAGIPTALLPNLFESERLEAVSAWPLGVFFSLSNHAVPEAERRRYIELSCEADRKRLLAVWEEPEAREMLSREEGETFCGLLEQKRDYLLAHLRDNRVWEWEGGASLLLTGRKPSEDGALVRGLLSLIGSGTEERKHV